MSEPTELAAGHSTCIFSGLARGWWSVHVEFTSSRVLEIRLIFKPSSKCGAMTTTYVVQLSNEERHDLEDLVKKGSQKSGVKPAALKLMRARILLKADQAEGSPAYADTQIAEALDVSAKTVFNIRQKWVELGI